MSMYKVAERHPTSNSNKYHGLGNMKSKLLLTSIYINSTNLQKSTFAVLLQIPHYLR